MRDNPPVLNDTDAEAVFAQGHWDFWFESRKGGKNYRRERLSGKNYHFVARIGGKNYR